MGKLIAQHPRAALLKRCSRGSCLCWGYPVSLSCRPGQLHASYALGLGTVALHGWSSSCLSEDGLNGEGKIAPCSSLSQPAVPWTARHRCPRARERAVPLGGRASQEGVLLSHCPAVARAAAAAADRSRSLEQSCLCPCSQEDRQRGPSDCLISRLRG